MADRSKPFSKRLNDYEGKHISDSRIENIDAAMFKYIDENLDLQVVTKSGFKKVPVVMTSAERMNLSKRQGLRDADGSLIMPVITVERTSMTKSPSEKGTVWANVPALDKVKGGSIPVMTRVLQSKSANFKNAHAKRKRGQLNFPTKVDKTVYQTVSIPLPVYVTINYEITLRTEYQQQMNQLVVPFITIPGGINYIIIRDGVHRYEGFIEQEYNHENNIGEFTNEERKFQTKFNIRVLGHLIGDGVNQETPHRAVRESIVEVKIPRERAVVDPEEYEKYDL